MTLLPGSDHARREMIRTDLPIPAAKFPSEPLDEARTRADQSTTWVQACAQGWFRWDFAAPRNAAFLGRPKPCIQPAGLSLTPDARAWHFY
jgi:hypothetical protein